MRLLCLLLFLFSYFSLPAHIYLSNCALRVGVSNLNLISESPLTSYYQPAVSHQGIACSISQPFQFSNIESGNLCFSQAWQEANFTVGSNYLISSNYSTYSNFLNYNYTFQKLITVGIGHKLISVFEEEKYLANSTDIGFMLKQEKVALALSYTNLFHNKSSKISLPNIISTELSYQPQADVFLGIGLEKEKNHKLNPKLGIRYQLAESLSLLSGYSLEPNQMTFGANISYNKFNISYAIATHNELKSSHYISLVYDL
ncbi:MAG: hypothetical protein WC155_07555 [Candidatus Cloacimonadales bacterium]